MRADVEYNPVGEGLGMSEFWLYVWMRRVAVIAAHVIAASVKGVVWYAFLLLPLFPALVIMNQITNAYLPRKKITT